MSEELSPLADFSGTARLFPLPNLVLFPQVMQPLHVFEPRYQQMTTEALAGDRLIAMVLLRPGWEQDYEGGPAIFQVACLTRIVAEQRLADGRFNILLRGLSRILIDHELPQVKLYRQARVELLTDASQPDPATQRKLRRQLLRRVPSWFSAQRAVLDQFRKLFRSDLPLSALCDITAFVLPLEVEVKQKLLEELNVEQRARDLLHYLEVQPPPPAQAQLERKFPPEFSVN